MEFLGELLDLGYDAMIAITLLAFGAIAGHPSGTHFVSSVTCFLVLTQVAGCPRYSWF